MLVERADPNSYALVFGPAGYRALSMPLNPAEYGKRLYSGLHDLDAEGAQEIQVEMPPDTPEWAAIWDRLRRAGS